MDPNARNLRLCSGCGEYLSDRQLGRHRALHRHRLEQEIAALMDDDIDLPDANPALGDPPVVPDDPAAAIDEVKRAVGDADVGAAIEMDEDGNPGNESQGFPGSVASMSLADDGNNPPALQPAQGRRRNPPVTIEDWPDPDSESEASEGDAAPIDDEDGDPAYIEQDEPLRFNPDDEPELNDADLWAILEAELGDLADDEWIDMYARDLSNRDRTVLQFLASRLRTHFSRQTYDDLRHGACEPLDIPSEFVAWRRLRILSGLETRAYDCCVASCCCFLGKYEGLNRCPFCNEPRYNARGKARRSFHYSPLIPQLQGLFQSASSIKKMRYRAKVEATHEPGKYLDVFDAPTTSRSPCRQTDSPCSSGAGAGCLRHGQLS
ncbi:hypothetical protein BDV93DRAFT_523439 [Ceratobasidium sp. AG-I]|nr:hypothetical protein BDV93DRAFT_523439 [Ceratobasidium sp. AG-I]